MGEKKKDSGEKLICEHRRARHDYAIDDTIEAGIALQGSEVKALRDGEGNLNDSYVLPYKGEVFLHNAHIGTYRPAAAFAHLPLRPRKLLMHRNEIEKWETRVTERGYSIVPLSMYFKNGRVKIRLGLGKGKKEIDRRHDIKARETRREIDRELNKRR